MRTGRPSTYTPEIAELICERIAKGESVIAITADEGMPTERTVYRWLEAHAEFCQEYVRARERQADHYAQEILEISDDGRNDWMERGAEGDAGWVANGEHIQRSRLRVDSRKWLASKLAPKKYGDKVTQEITGAGGGPVVTQVIDYAAIRLGAK